MAGELGDVNKQQQLDQVRHRSQGSRVLNRIIENQHFRFYGDVALVTEVDRYPADNRR